MGTEPATRARRHRPRRRAALRPGRAGAGVRSPGAAESRAHGKRAAWSRRSHDVAVRPRKASADGRRHHRRAAGGRRTTRSDLTLCGGQGLCCLDLPSTCSIPLRCVNSARSSREWAHACRPGERDRRGGAASAASPLGEGRRRVCRRRRDRALGLVVHRPAQGTEDHPGVVVCAQRCERQAGPDLQHERHGRCLDADVRAQGRQGHHPGRHAGRADARRRLDRAARRHRIGLADHSCKPTSRVPTFTSAPIK